MLPTPEGRKTAPIMNSLSISKYCFWMKPYQSSAMPKKLPYEDMRHWYEQVRVGDEHKSGSR